MYTKSDGCSVYRCQEHGFPQTPQEFYLKPDFKIVSSSACSNEFECYHAHLAILALHIPFFAMFAKCSPNNCKECKLEFSIDIIKTFVDAIYSGIFTITCENCVQMMLIADYLSYIEMNFDQCLLTFFDIIVAHVPSGHRFRLLFDCTETPIVICNEQFVGTHSNNFIFQYSSVKYWRVCDETIVLELENGCKYTVKPNTNNQVFESFSVSCNHVWVQIIDELFCQQIVGKSDAIRYEEPFTIVTSYNNSVVIRDSQYTRIVSLVNGKLVQLCQIKIAGILLQHCNHLVLHIEDKKYSIVDMLNGKMIQIESKHKTYPAILLDEDDQFAILVFNHPEYYDLNGNEVINVPNNCKMFTRLFTK